MPGPDPIDVAERQRQAVELRRAGASYEQIARQLEYRGKSGAFAAVRAALKKAVVEEVDELRTLEQERLDLAQAAIWVQVRNGNLGAIDRFLRIQDRRARLLGLDAPMKVAPTTPDGMNEYMGAKDSEEEANANIARILSRVVPKLAATNGHEKLAEQAANVPDGE